MEIHRGLLFSLLLVALMSLIRTTSSLPPDFFRNGLVHGSRRSSPSVTRASSWWGSSWGSTRRRPQSQQRHYGKRGDMLPHKRSSVESDLISSACTFCGSFSSNFNFECKQNIGTRRRDCVLAYVEQVESVLSKRGWK